MIEDDIAIHLLSQLIAGGRRMIGEEAIKLANEIKGLSVRSNGEIVVGGDVFKIFGSLCREYEKSLQGKLVLDIEVRMNLKRGGV